jgi:uncharacterized membrane protein YdjX (TVP38/TMEM64 family)
MSPANPPIANGQWEPGASPAGRRWHRWALASVVALAVVGFYALGLHRYFSWEYLHAHLDLLRNETQQHLLLALLLFALIYVSVTALSLPVATALGLTAGALFGRWLGTGVVSLAATLGATLAFLGSRYLFRDGVQRRFGSRLAAINRGVEQDGAYYLLTLRLVPAFPFFLVNLGLGLTPMRARTFAWVSLLGMLPGTFLYVNLGAELSRIDSPRTALSPRMFIPLALLGLVPLALRLFLRWTRSRRHHDEHGGHRGPGEPAAAVPCNDSGR